MTCYQVSDEKTVYILGLQSAVCGLYFVLTGLVLLFLLERASNSDRIIVARKKIFSETIAAALIDVWTVCRRAPEDKHNDRAMITLYQLKTNVNA